MSDSTSIPTRQWPDRTGGVDLRPQAQLTENLGLRVPRGYRAKLLAFSKQKNLRFSEAVRHVIDRGLEVEGAI